MNSDSIFMQDYSRGMDMLSLGNRAFANLVRRLGYPIADETIPTAQVQLNMDGDRIEFRVNPNFLHGLPDSSIAAVLAHETYHVLLDHLSEIGDRIAYPLHGVLVDAQECIINDTIPSSTGFVTPEGTFRGMERHGADFSNFTSREAYDFILQKQQEQEQEQQEQDDSNEQNSDSSDSGDSNGADGSSDDKSANDSSSQQSENSEEQGSEEPADGSPASNDQPAQEGNESSSSEDEQAEDSHADGCQGVKVVGEGSDDAQAVADSLSKAITKAINDGRIDLDQLPQDVQQALEELNDNGIDVPTPSYSIGQPRDAFQTLDPYAALNVNWRQLLAEINPKINSHGRPKPKDSWHAPRRRMLHSYPDVILPTRKPSEPDLRHKGDALPTFVIALDMSGSIPTTLLTTLAGFAQSIPEKLIKGFPITWSDDWKIFDPERPREKVYSGGTTISKVMEYVRKVEKETGVRPYVLVISDGLYNIPSSWDSDEIQKYWYWMAIQRKDRDNFKRSTIGRFADESHLFALNDFI